MLQVTPENIDQVRMQLTEGNVRFRMLIDRASESDARFGCLLEWGRREGVLFLDDPDRVYRSWNKAEMHLRLIRAGYHTPHTVILPSCGDSPGMPPVDLSFLGKRFVVKPAHGSGGTGVARADTPEEVSVLRTQHPGDQYLLQEYIDAASISDRPAWFRVIWCLGRIYPCWWHPQTHIYAEVGPEEEIRMGLKPLRDIASGLADICELGLFSSEIALAPDGRFVVVDYINDQIDLRLQSATTDGVPDVVAGDIAGRIAAFAAPCPGLYGLAISVSDPAQ